MRHRSFFPAAFCTMAVALAAFAAPATVSGQPRSALVGHWTVEYEVGRRVEDGEAHGIRGTGTFSIAQSGDSLLVTIQAPARPDGTVPPPATVGARGADGATTCVQKQKVRVNMNGEETMHDVTLTWSLKVDGDALTGTLSRVMQDMPEMAAPSAVTGTRVKS